MCFNETVGILKSRLDELAYSSVLIEGVGSTLAQTREVMERGAAAGLDEESTAKLLGIKRALSHLFEHAKEPVTWSLYSTYNALVGDGTISTAGKMRGPGEVCVDDYEPPDVDVAKFDEIVGTSMGTAVDPSEAASTMFLLLCRAQFFHDGNKRSAQMIANHYLAHVDARCALIVPEGRRDEVLNLLVDFYHGRTSLQDASFDLEDIVIKHGARGGGGEEMEADTLAVAEAISKEPGLVSPVLSTVSVSK